MEEKKKVKLSLGTAICIFIIIVLLLAIGGMAYYYNFVKKDSNNLNAETKQVQTDKKEEKVEFSNSQIKEALQVYLELIGCQEGSPAALLEKLDLLDNISNNNITSDGYIKTDIKYSEYKNKLLNYMSEGCFNENFTSLYKNENGLLCYFDGGATGVETKVDSVELKSNTENTYVASVYDINLDDSKNYYSVEFTIDNKNGKCIIASCKNVLTSTKVENTEFDDVVTAQSYGQPLIGEASLKDGYLYYSSNGNDSPRKIEGVSNIKSLNVYNIGTGINKVPFVVTQDGVVYRLNDAEELVVYEELSKYKVDKIISCEGELYTVFKIQLKDGTTKTIKIDYGYFE